MTNSKIILDITNLDLDDKMIVEYNNYYSKNILYNPNVNKINTVEILVKFVWNTNY